MPTTVTKWGFSVPLLVGEQADGPAGFTALANGLANVAMWTSGTLASRPTTGLISGMSYYATDTGQEFIYNGSAWAERDMGPSVPVGSSIEYGGVGDPADTRYLLEDGRVLTRSSYAACFAVLGTRFNTGGEQSTEFRIPDSRGRVAVAADNMSTSRGAANVLSSGRALGQYGGTELQLLTAQQMPSHWHEVDLYRPTDGVTAGPVVYGGGSVGPSIQTPALTEPTGGNAPHNNMQPYVVKNKIIRVR